MDIHRHRRPEVSRVPGVADLLRSVDLRPTRQRLALGRLLFSGERHRHVTAEQLFAEATGAGVQVSLATVYNTLHQFTAAGLLREVVIESGRAYFDTNVEDHHHMILPDREGLIDVPQDRVDIGALPDIPPGYAIDHIHVVVQLKRDGAASADPRPN